MLSSKRDSDYYWMFHVAEEERDEARELARTILQFFDGMGMRPDWERRCPWLKETDRVAESPATGENADVH